MSIIKIINIIQIKMPLRGMIIKIINIIQIKMPLCGISTSTAIYQWTQPECLFYCRYKITMQL